MGVWYSRSFWVMTDSKMELTIKPIFPYSKQIIEFPSEAKEQITEGLHFILVWYRVNRILTRCIAINPASNPSLLSWSDVSPAANPLEDFLGSVPLIQMFSFYMESYSIWEIYFALKALRFSKNPKYAIAPASREGPEDYVDTDVFQWVTTPYKMLIPFERWIKHICQLNVMVSFII